MLPGLMLSSIVALSLSAALASPGNTSRTCDIWTGPCFANAEMNLSGKNARMAWKVESGSVGDVRLDGLSVIAIVSAKDTLGLAQTGAGKTVLIVDERASKAQREALVVLAKKQGGVLTKNIVSIQFSPIDMTICECKEGGCARVKAGNLARIETRCLHSKHDKACGNESAFYPPLAAGVKAKPAMAVEHSFTGEGINETWKETERRGAYLGSFEIR